MPLNLEVHPGYVKDKKSINLSKNQSDKIRSDLKDLVEGKKQGKQLTGTYFPLKELKYRNWGIRAIFIEEKDKIIVLSVNRKKDNKTKAYSDAIKRLNR